MYHDEVRAALEKDGWTITQDPFTLTVLDGTFGIDLAAEKIIAAERHGQKIAVEIKSFVAQSFLNEFHSAIGQFGNYLIALEAAEKDRMLYLAVPQKAYDIHFGKEYVQRALAKFEVSVMVYDPTQPAITLWQPIK